MGASDTHLAVQCPPSARTIYVAMGASDTFGTGTNNPATQCWPTVLTNKLGSSTRLINLGIPGIDVHDALNIELPVALDAHPTLITVWLAVNDLVDKVPLAQYKRDMETFVQRLHTSEPQARILIANVPDLTLLPHYRQSRDAQALRIFNKDWQCTELILPISQ